MSDPRPVPEPARTRRGVLFCVVLVPLLLALAGALLVFRSHSRTIGNGGDSASADAPTQDADADAAAQRRRQAAPEDAGATGAPQDAVAWVELHVCDAHGQPLPRAQATITAGDDRVVATTDAAGIARLGAPRADVWWLGVRAAGCAASGERGVLLERGVVARLDVVLDPACTLRLRVVDEDGAPVVGARVDALNFAPSGWMPPPPVTTETSAEDGRVVFEGLAPGRTHVLVDDDTEAGLLAVDLPCADEALLIVPAGGTVEGLVTDAGSGAPVAGAWVTYGRPLFRGEWLCGELATLPATRTGPDGRYRLRRLQDDPRADLVSAFAPDRQRAVRELPDVGVLAAAQRRADLELRRGGTLTIAVSASGRRLARAEVLVVPARSNRVARSPSPRTRSGNDPFEPDANARLDDHGELVLVGAGPGEYDVFVALDGRRCETDPGTVRVPELGADRVELELDAAPRTLRGEVRDCDGMPVPGARVRLPAGDPLGRRAFAVSTDSEGRFELGSRRHPVDWDGLVVCPPGWLVAVVAPLPDSAGDASTLVRLPPPTTVHGRLVRADGTPLHDVELRVGDAHYLFEERVPVAADHTFRFVAPSSPDAPTRIRLTARSPVCGVTESALSLGAARDVDAGELVLTPRHRVTLRVVDDTQAPVPGAEITSTECDDFSWSDASRHLGVTDAHGSAELALLFPDKRLRVTAPRHVAAEVDAATLPAEVVLARRNDLTGRVLFADGSPARGTIVALRAEEDGPPTAETSCDDEGRFLVRGATPGPAFASVRPVPGRGPQPPPVDLGACELADGVVLVVPCGRTVLGRVVDEHGAPIAGARVCTRVADFFQGGDEIATDSDGRFRFDGLPLSDARELRVEDELHPCTVIVRDLARFDGGTVTVVLPRIVRTRGALLGPDGAPAAGESIRASPKAPWTAPCEPNSVRTTTADDGSFEFDAIAGVTYSLVLVESERFAAALDGADAVDAGSTGTFRASLGRCLRGRLVDERGTGIPDIPVRVTGSGGGRVPPSETGDDGTFLITRIPDGAQRLDVSWTLPGVERHRPVTLTQLDTPVTEHELVQVASQTARIRGRVLRRGDGAQQARRLRLEGGGCRIDVEIGFEDTFDVGWLVAGVTYDVSFTDLNDSNSWSAGTARAGDAALSFTLDDE